MKEVIWLLMTINQTLSSNLFLEIDKFCCSAIITMIITLLLNLLSCKQVISCDSIIRLIDLAVMDYCGIIAENSEKQRNYGGFAIFICLLHALQYCHNRKLWCAKRQFNVIQETIGPYLAPEASIICSSETFRNLFIDTKVISWHTIKFSEVPIFLFSGWEIPRPCLQSYVLFRF